MDPLGVAFVYKSSIELNVYNYHHYRKETIPMHSNSQALLSKGLIELKPHTYIFYQDVHGSQDPNNDLLKLWVTHDQQLRVQFPDDISALETVRNQLLGPLDQLKGGEKGSTWLEKSGRGNSVVHQICVVSGHV